MLASTIASVQAPAAGAPMAQIAIATVFGVLSTAVLLWLVAGHRSGRSQALTRAGGLAQRLTGLEPWAALPVAVATVGLVAGGFGVFWDISLHIDVGRDEGPLANPSHYPIMFCLYSLFAAGILAFALHENAEHPSPRALALPGGHSIPVGGALLGGAGLFALTGFPLDDVWHRMFGQDVTLWGPTHLVMINGAILSVPILAVLTLEAKRAAGHALAAPPKSAAEHLVRLILPGALLFAIAFWATEFDWGIPQYRQVWHPVLLAAAGGVALTTGRLWLGRGGAVRVVLTYLVIRGSFSLGVGGLGQTVPAMPLFLAEALAIELLLWRRGAELRPLRSGLAAGLACGTVGFAAAYAWTHVWAPLPWQPSLLAEGLPSAILAGVAGGLLGALLGSALIGTLPGAAVRRRAALGATAILVVVGTNALITQDPRAVRADVRLAPVAGAAGREAVVEATVSDPEVVRDAQSAYVLAWQGGGRRAVGLREVAPGTFRATEAVPLHGEWKTMLRVQDGRRMLNVPLHLPREPSVPTPGLERPERFTAAFVDDHRVMQTERRDYVPAWLWTPAALLMLAFCGLFFTGIGMGIGRICEQERGDGAPPRRPRERRAPALAGAGS
ncbi:MAG TPA: hypothetical protein VD931_11910 [Baekduia sp.]|nr:hypothetical protein [Baekduia sp.]